MVLTRPGCCSLVQDGTREQATASSNQSKTVTAPSETQASFEASLLERILIELNTPELKPLQLRSSHAPVAVCTEPACFRMR
jgi:hypothetical protein